MGFLFLVSMSAIAQVTIKERVEIGGASLPNATVHNVLSTGEAIWVAPAPGFWKLRVTAVSQALSPISSAYFQVITPEATFTGNIAEWASRQDNQWFTFFDYCTGRDTLGWYYAINGVTPYDRTLAIHVASAGDTLRFRYHSDFGASDFAEIYQDPYPEWVIRLGLDHPCIRREAFTPPHDLCQLHLSYFYDTTFTRFAIETLKDTIAHGDTLDFHVVAMSALNQETPLEGDTPLTLRISPSKYGRFISLTGDTVPSPLSNIRYQDAREGRIRFVAKGTTPDSLQPVAIEAIQMSDTTKRGTGTFVIVPDTAELEIINPIAGTIDSSITAEPRMPQLKARARLKHYKRGDVFFDWKFVLRWVNLQRSPEGQRLEDRVISCSFESKDTVQNADTSAWTIPWGQLIRGGDIDTLYVTGQTSDRIFRDTVINPYRIRGINPHRDSVKADLSIQQQVVVFKESSWRQFNGSPGFPLYGRPRGYGVMQVDPPTDQQVWDWRANRTSGIAVITRKYNEAVGYGDRIRRGVSNPHLYERRYVNATDLTTDEQLWKEAFHRYRGGSYWTWRPDDKKDSQTTGHWGADPQQGHDRGAEDWQLCQDVLGGYPPTGW